MSDAISLVELLAELGGLEVLLTRNDATLAVAVVALPAGRRLLAIERTYREGIKVLFDPRDTDIEVARSGDLWAIWNDESDRLRWLDSVAGRGNGPAGSDGAPAAR